MKLTRKHELALIDIGLQTLLDRSLIIKKVNGTKPLKEVKKEVRKLHWTQDPKNKTKIKRIMKKMWKARSKQAKEA